MDVIMKAVITLMLLMMNVDGDVDSCRRRQSRVLVCDRWSDHANVMMQGIEVLRIKRCADRLITLSIAGPALKIVTIDKCHMTCKDVTTPHHLTLTMNGKKCLQDRMQTSTSYEEITDAAITTTSDEKTTSTTVIENVLIAIDKSWMIVALIAMSLLLITIIACCVKVCRKCKRDIKEGHVETRTYQLRRFDVESLDEMDVRDFKRD